MTHIGLLSDTHGYLNPKCYEFFKDCNEIWHAGDIGNIQVADALSEFKPLKAVFGNIDGQDIRAVYKEYMVFMVERVKVLMMHIGGYPGHYSKVAREMIEREKPDLFVTGHSHILKVMYDKKIDCLHMNPGAAGKSGIHATVTMMRFIIDRDQIKDLEVFDIEKVRK